jgi:hypothetical protein
MGINVREDEGGEEEDDEECSTMEGEEGEEGEVQVAMSKHLNSFTSRKKEDYTGCRCVLYRWASTRVPW